jgi:hypothetical protein
MTAFPAPVLRAGRVRTDVIRRRINTSTPTAARWQATRDTGGSPICLGCGDEWNPCCNSVLSD